jgi:hypothetical protein
VYIFLSLTYRHTLQTRQNASETSMAFLALNAFPEIARQFVQELNPGVDIGQVTQSSHVKLWWRCTYGHYWDAQVKSRTLGRTGCPVCNVSKAEAWLQRLCDEHPAIMDSVPQCAIQCIDSEYYSCRMILRTISLMSGCSSSQHSRRMGSHSWKSSWSVECMLTAYSASRHTSGSVTTTWVLRTPSL